MSLGLKRGTVQLEPHDKQWDETAIQTIKTLKSILCDDAIDIQHIGSTAIPVIKAKPIIDIVVGVTDFERIMLHNEQLQKEGIFYRGSDMEYQIVDMNCQDWYIIQQKQGEYTHESELIFKTLYVHVLRTYTAINMQG